MNSGSPLMRNYQFIETHLAYNYNKNVLSLVGCNPNDNRENLLKCAQNKFINHSIFLKIKITKFIIRIKFIFCCKRW